MKYSAVWSTTAQGSTMKYSHDSHDTHDEEDEGSDDHQEDDGHDDGQDDGQEGQHVTSSSSLSRRGIKTKSIYEELRESNVSPKQRDKSKSIPVSHICGAPHRRSGKHSKGSRETVKEKKKPVVSITVNTPLMSDLAKHSSPSKNISIMLPYRSAEN